jgi:hypothetical protein
VILLLLIRTQSVSKEEREREMKSREQGEEKITSDLFKTRLSLRIEKGLSCGKTR